MRIDIAKAIFMNMYSLETGMHNTCLDKEDHFIFSRL